MITHCSLIRSIGNTPIVPVNLVKNGTLYAKLEYLNPGGSVKDRTARYMIEQAEHNGILKPGGTIIDASSGNHGIAIAMIGALKGYNVTISVSEKISREKLDTIHAYGAYTLVCKPTDFMDDPASYHSRAVALHKDTPGSYMPNQYYSTQNRDAHYNDLGPEIWKQTNGTITHFFAGAGTGGTVSGVGRYLKEQNPGIKVIACDSANSFRATNGHPKPYAIEGIGIDFDSEVMDYNIIDEILTVTDEQALGMLKSLAHTHGLLAGPSSGAVAYSAQQYAQEHMRTGDVGIMIFGDSGRAYLSKGFYT